MKQGLSFGTRMVLTISTAILLVLACLISIQVWQSYRFARVQALANGQETARRCASQVSGVLNNAMLATHVLAQNLEGMKLALADDRDLYQSLLSQVLRGNAAFANIWSVWEPDALDGKDEVFKGKKGYDGTGRFIPCWTRAANDVSLDKMVGYATAEYYVRPRDTGQETLVEPRQVTLNGKERSVTTVAVPMRYNGTFVGVVGVDIPTENLQEMIGGIRPYGTGWASLIGSSKRILADQDRTRIGSLLDESAMSQQIKAAMASNDVAAATVYSETLQADVYQIVVPVVVGQSQIRWSLVVNLPVDKVLADARRAMYVSILTGAVALLIMLVVVALLARSISQPILRLTGMLKDISEGEGDLTKRLAVIGHDELAAMAVYFNLFVEKLQGVIGHVAGNANTVASAATGLSAVSAQMAQSVQTMATKANTVATAAEESCANTYSVAMSMEQTSSNLASVASATEEMSATIGEIAANSGKARVISSEATQQAQVISTMMKELGTAAQDIGKVTETISGISAQTNLLALNATIEAARAGAAGKGFAVVANEIKALARQTAMATDEIKGKISAIQTSTDGAIVDIAKITTVIQQVGEIVTTIAAAIEQQATVTRDVASNIAQASTSVKDSNERVAETSKVSQSMAEEIAAVTVSVNEIKTGGEQIQSRANELSALAELLKDEVAKFKV